VTEEVDQIFGDWDRPCTIQDVAELKYLECCIKETLRLYPSVPAVMRYITEDIHVGNGKLFLNTYSRVNNLYYTFLLLRWLQNTSRSLSFIDDIWNASQPSGLSGSTNFQSGTFPTRKRSRSSPVRFRPFQCRASQLYR
jgi:hypothetical protein